AAQHADGAAQRLEGGGGVGAGGRGDGEDVWVDLLQARHAGRGGAWGLPRLRGRLRPGRPPVDEGDIPVQEPGQRFTEPRQERRQRGGRGQRPGDGQKANDARTGAGQVAGDARARYRELLIGG